MTFYGLYKITNLVDGKIYIGQHVTEDLDDGYFGSGVYLKRAVKKHGRQNFRKEWLMFCEDREELDYMERVFVDDTFVLRSDTYNLQTGGSNPLPRPKGLKRSAETKSRISSALKGRHLSEECKAKLSESRKIAWADPETRAKLMNANSKFFGGGYKFWSGRHLSAETKAKIADARRGMFWWTDGERCVFARECPGEGFVKGRKRKLA